LRVWITRAEPGATRTAGRVQALGLIPISNPLLKVHRLHAVIDLIGVDGLVFTSINGVDAFAGLCADRDLPVLTVGDATARAASAAGFGHVTSAAGDIQALAALIRSQDPGRLLHAAAREPAGNLAGAVADVVEVVTLPVYATEPAAETAIPAADVVLLHSPRAADLLAARLSSVQARSLAAVCISPNAAAPLRDLPLTSVEVAERPDEPAMMVALGKAIRRL